MAIRTYIVASRTYRLGRVVEIGETIPLEETLADGDDTLVKLPEMPDDTTDTTNTQGLPSDKVEPELAQPEPIGGAQTTEVGADAADASPPPETGEADGSGVTAAAPPADQAAETTAADAAETKTTKSKAKKAD